MSTAALDLRSRPDQVCCALAVGVGIVLAVLPHLATLCAHGTLECLLDKDDVWFAAQARAAYYGETVMRDPLCRSSEGVPSFYSWYQFVPWGWLTRRLGLPLVQVLLLWRIAGGALMGGVLFLVFRSLLRDTRAPSHWALGCTVIGLSDTGFVLGPPVLSVWRLLAWMLVLGRTPHGTSQAMAQLRVVTPLCNLPFLLLVLYSLGRTDTSRLRRFASTFVWLSVLIALYNYYWIAALLALSVYAVVLLATRRPAEAGLVVAVLAAAFLWQGPSLWGRLSALAPLHDSLVRTGKDVALAPGDALRTAQLHLPQAWFSIGVGALGILLFRMRRLEPWWCMTVAAYLLYGSAALTGIESENYHWVFVLGPCGAIMVLTVAALRLEAGRYRRFAWAVPAMLLAVALAWRPFETLRAPETMTNSRLLAEFSPLQGTLAQMGPDTVLAGPVETRIAMLYGQCGQLYEHYMMVNTLVPQAELQQRYALNYWLMGMSREAFAEHAHTDKIAVFDIPTIEFQSAEAYRLQVFDSLDATGPRLMKHYGVQYLLSAPAAPQRGGPWQVLGQTEHWTLYSKPQ